MHPIRRRKKRPNYGVRTMEVARGKNGFGFTISGQQPCILSCIVNNSPAEKAGLRPGDYLVAVNGQSVSKLPHDDVVRLIGSSNGILKLQIAENYYSDSSDEDQIVAARSKPKYLSKPRNSSGNHRAVLQNRVAKVVRDLRTGTVLDKFSDDMNGSHALLEKWEVPELPPPRLSNAQNSSDRKEELCFIIGYLGTIEMPKQIQPGCRPQVVRGCIKRLRAEKRTHNWVLVRVHADGVTVAGNGGKILAEYPVNRITYCGASSEEDKKYLGLVTTANREDGDSSSCHIFAVQPNLSEHQKHASKASAFKVNCTSGELSEGCLEFPSTSEPILNAIRSFCLTKDEGNRPNEILPANSPQPSQAGSTAASSNSDSGIGFRDDCGNQSDRIVMVDIENQRLHIQQLYNNSKNMGDRNTLNIQLQGDSFETPSANLQQAFACVSALCPLPFDPLCVSSGHRTRNRPIPDGKITTSNRSRSPLNSPSSSDDDKTLTKHVHSKNKGKSNGKMFFMEDAGDRWQDRSIFYQLGMCSDVTPSTSKHGYESAYKLTSKSFDSLDHQPLMKTGDVSKLNSNSIDNLIHMSSDYYRLSPQVNVNKTLDVKGSPLSISYGNGSIIQLNREKSTEEEITFCDKENECSMSPDFGRRVLSDGKGRDRNGPKKDHFKSADDIMSICSYKSNDMFLSYKLSPKVFGVNRTTQSLEDLKGPDPMGEAKDAGVDSRVQHWGSLQDLRSFVSGCYESSKDMVLDEKESCGEDIKNEGVALWATSFEKLLEDPSGLHTFAEFLKKEFSQENIIFWVSCEKYNKLEDESERKVLASQIFETHLAVGAPEPVNVDAHATQSTQNKLSEAPPDLFLSAQKQIFNLMKFDSYPRFIKSELYKECLLREMSGEELPYQGDAQLTPNLNKGETPSRGKLKKSRSDADDCRRKSLLPWHKKNRSKSKDRGESEYKLSTMEQKRENEDVISVKSEITSSRSSLASWDLALRGSFSRQSITSGDASERENCMLCRVILSDGATTVVQVRQNESIRELIHRLLEKRGLHYSSFEVYLTGSQKPLSLDEEAASLSNKEVRVEQRVVFRVDLPNRKTVSIKAKTSKTLGQVLRSVLHKYSYRLELITVCSMSENEVLELSLPVTAVDGRRLTVLTRSESWRNENHPTAAKTFVKAAPTLDEITNRVFEELLQGKSEGIEKSEQGSIKSEELGSEHSSGIFGRFLRRDSAYHERSRSKGRATGRQILEGASKHMEGVVSMVTGKPPLISKWKTGSKISGKSESDELYEGLKRAQRSRLEDQRGTEINFELPDFLKDKENEPKSGKKLRKIRKEDGASTPRQFCSETEQTNKVQQENAQNINNKTTPWNDKVKRRKSRRFSLKGN
ncbi:UNVERIFIED_CONTAM: hypothetical protein PYX00_007383 [Menopon gallinae]|uniref:Regulator of G-protein signaling loco n=1 Tax=Menopon gallinae TaxID=328185 RepID=A0AAW2HIV0_9NEOP